MTLFARTWRLTVGELRVNAPLRIAFEIERTVRPQPNTAHVKVWNLTREHQAQLEQARDAQVIVEAGYANDRGLEQLFRGRARSTRSQRDGADVLTEIEARDGGREFQQARIEASFEPGVSVSTVLRRCVDALGIGAGNLDEVARIAQLETGGDTYGEGTVLSGQASRELTRILASYGLRWSVQHGALQVLRRGSALQHGALRLTPETGLVGSPEIGSRGRVRARALLTPELWPGRRVALQSQRAEGHYAVRAVTYTGDSHGDEWFASCELAPEGTAP